MRFIGDFALLRMRRGRRPSARTMWVIPAQAAMLATQLLVAILLARLLSVHDRGMVLGALLLIGLGVTATSGGLTLRAARAAANCEGYGRGMAMVLTLYATVTLGLLALLSTTLPSQEDLIFGLLMIAFGPLGVLTNCLSSTAAGEGRLLTSVLIQWLPSLTAALGICMFILLRLPLSVEIALSLYLSGNALAAVVGAFNAYRSGVFNTTARSVSSFGQILRESLLMSPAAISQLLGLRLDSLLLTYISGPAALSIYAAANSMASPIQMPVAAARGRIIARGRKTLSDPMPLAKMSVAWILLCITLVLLAAPLVVRLFGPDYAVALTVLPVLALAGGLQLVRDVMASSLLGVGEAKRVSIVEVVLAIISLPIYLSMIAWNSYMGAAIASCVVYAMAGIVFLNLIRNRTSGGAF